MSGGTWDGSRRRTLAEKIANSTCKICGARGHWRRECPNNPDREDLGHHKKEVTHLTLEVDQPADAEMLQDYGDSVPYGFDGEPDVDDEDSIGARQATEGARIQGSEQTCFMITPKVMSKPKIGAFVASRLLMFDRSFRAEHRQPPATMNRQEARHPESTVLESNGTKALNPDVVLVTTSGAEGVLDTGASRTVIGENRVQSLLSGIPSECRQKVRKAKSDVTFRFGNSGVLTAKHALLLPAQGGKWIRVEVVPGDTPLLISNRLLRDLDAVIYVRREVLRLQGACNIPLRTDDKGLSIVDMSSLLHVDQEAFNADVSHVKPQQQKPDTDINTLIPSTQLKVDLETSSSATSPSTPQCQHGAESVRCRQEDRELQSSAPGGGLEPTPFGGGRRGLGGGHVEDRRLPQRHLRQASQHSVPEGMGHSAVSAGETQSRDLLGHLRYRPPVLSPDVSKDYFDVGLGEKLPELRSRPTQSSCAGSRGGAQPGQAAKGRADVQSQDAGGAGDGRGRVEAVCPSRDTAQQPQDGGTSKERRGDQHELPHEGGHRQGGDPDATSSSTSRAGGPGRSRGRQLSDCERGAADVDTEGVCARIDQCINQIEALLQASVREPDPCVSSYRLPSLDLLEVSMEPGGGQVSASIQKCGGRSLYLFGNNIGSARDDYSRLWKLISMYEPQHVWVDARRLWHVGKKCSDKTWSENLFLELFRYQTEQGKHFHLEGAHDLAEHKSPGFEEIGYGTLKVVHDPVELAGKKIPCGNNFLRQSRYIYTTSRQLHQTIDTRWSQSGPPEPKDPQDQPRHDKAPRNNTSRSCRRSTFAQQVAQHILHDYGYPLLFEELLVGSSDGDPKRKESNSDPAVSAVQQVLKRRRLLRKQPPPVATSNPSTSSEPNAGLDPLTWERVFQQLNGRVPVKKRVSFQEGDEEVKLVQQLVPEFIVKHVVVCRGTNRIQPAPAGCDVRDIPLRYTVVVKRAGGDIAVDGAIEEWTKIPKYKQGRKGIPAKMSLTAFGAPAVPVVRSRSGPIRDEGNGVRVGAPEPPSEPESRPETDTTAEARPTVSSSEPAQRDHVVPDVPEGLVSGFPPRSIPKHGPGYLDLDEAQKRELGRLHYNLGHPNTETFVKFLQERKAEPALIRGARDFSCSVCLEMVAKQKPSRPSAIHVDRDFGDTIGMDVAYWTNGGGKQFMFTHVVDEGTLFQMATAVGRTQEEQYEFLSEQWFAWAGPCSNLYVDPAGEYSSDYWRERLQRDNVRAIVSAGGAHWQLGRVESHGKLLKNMLTKMDSEMPICSDAEFRASLKAAIQAKNSLSRVRGFSPEQAVFGKMSRLPASIVGDEQAGSHALADSNSPEGFSFRQSLQRREAARAAFVRADNDSSFRRALLRRSRPPGQSFESGDWVLYWRRQRCGTRAERGRWFGPGQVIVSEPKVIWISHCGQLVRAAPEQVRSASLREWQNVVRQEATGNSGDQGTRRVLDLASTGEVPHSRAEVEEQGQSPEDRVPSPLAEEVVPNVAIPRVVGDNLGMNTEQPEMEVSPAVSETGPQEVPDEIDPQDIPVPEDDDEDLLFGDCEDFLLHPNSEQAWEIVLYSSDLSPENLPSPSQSFHYVCLATEERKKRVEVNLRDLSREEQEQFRLAKAKEVGAWIDHGTVRRIAAGTLDDRQIMRCRWILTWKSPEKEGGPKRAKARLVVLGFEDPDLDRIPNDAPTLGKDGRQLILQKVASKGWKLINFDISTAFLQGHGDGRALGIKPPDELKQAMGLKPGEQCQLEGGAYGRIDAPFLWFQTLKGFLEELGFIQCPFDACTFCLVSPGTDGQPEVHGVLGVHVDDGLGGGDAKFEKAVQKLRERFSFGSYDEGEFTFTGIRFRQWDDGSIEYDQQGYIEGIRPIHIPRERRLNPTASLTPEEVKELRRLNGSLQYAAVHTRPDIAAKVGYLQTRITKGEVQHLVEANRVLHEAKVNPISLMVVPLEEDHVTFCTFSDASFATSKDNNSYQGTLVMVTDWRMLANKQAVISPIAWSSKKIARVVRSTLSAEVVSLCGSMDRMSWIRLFWEWLKDPAINLASPEEVLARAPKASLVTDCKSAFDVSTKTAVPACSELRTQLECLLLRERLRENCQMRWVHSRAMLADCLTKVMDSSALRQCIHEGKYALFDEGRILEQRKGHRQSLQWLRNTKSERDTSPTFE